MSEHVAKQFIDALGTLESSRDVEPIGTTYAENCEVGNVNVPGRFKGHDGARRFWTEYRETFGEIQSTFRNIIATDGRAALAWTKGHQCRWRAGPVRRREHPRDRRRQDHALPRLLRSERTRPPDQGTRTVIPRTERASRPCPLRSRHQRALYTASRPV